jgi:hypothetical protein
MRSSSLFASVVVIGLVASMSGSAAADDYPMAAATFRTRMDKLVDTMRAACARQRGCSPTYVESGIAQMKVRTLEACRDGTVTRPEAEWVFAAVPTLPKPPPPPGPPPKDDDGE